MRSSFFLLLALLYPMCSTSASPGPNEMRPNILFVLIDDMGWPDLGCYGHSFHETPRLDQLAREGMKFSNFYATPVCSSTRGTIESGQNSARTGITDFLPGHWKPFAKLIVPAMPDHLEHQLTTPGEALGNVGYTTGYFGKWHLGWTSKNAPDKHGYAVTAANLGKEFQQWRPSKEEGPKRMNLLTDQALWFLEQQAENEGPFFLHLSHHAVHIPIQGELATIEKYKEKTKPANGVNHPVYAAMVQDLDKQIGRLLDSLQKHGLAENTVVIVASDNGGLQEVYTQTGQVVSTNAPLRAEKGTIYEGGIRVPCIVHWPGVTQAGSTCKELAATWDLLPTFCSLANIPAPDQSLDGVDLTPLLKDPNAKLSRDALHFHYPHYHHSRPAGAIRSGDFKLIEWFENGSVELYNLKADVGESNDLAATMPEKANELRSRLQQWRKKVGARMPTTNASFNPDKADLWWDRRTETPLDLKAMGDRFQQRATPPYFRTQHQ